MTEVKQQLAFVLTRSREPEVAENVLQKLRLRELAIEKICVGNVFALFQQSKQASKQQGFPGSYLSSQHNKSLVPPNAIIKRCQRLVVPLGREKKSGIGRELERVAREVEETLVH